MRTSFHHQPEAQHPKSSAIHKLPADYPIYRTNNGQRAARRLDWSVAFDPIDPSETWGTFRPRCSVPP
jgi:hypothetical protein